MKKIFPLLLSAVMIFSLCACGGKNKSVSFSPKVNSAFSVTADIKNGDEQASAVITKHGTANWDAEFSAPNTLAGVLISYRDDTVGASYKGLSFSVPKSALPLKSMISNLISAIDSMADMTEISCEEDGDIMLYQGENEQGKYTVKFNKDGSLCGFEMPNFELVITFTDFSENPSAPESESVTEAETSEATGSSNIENMNEAEATEETSESAVQPTEE